MEKSKSSGAPYKFDAYMFFVNYSLASSFHLNQALPIQMKQTVKL